MIKNNEKALQRFLRIISLVCTICMISSFSAYADLSSYHLESISATAQAGSIVVQWTKVNDATAYHLQRKAG